MDGASKAYIGAHLAAETGETVPAGNLPVVFIEVALDTMTVSKMAEVTASGHLQLVGMKFTGPGKVFVIVQTNGLGGYYGMLDLTSSTFDFSRSNSVIDG